MPPLARTRSFGGIKNTDPGSRHGPHHVALELFQVNEDPWFSRTEIRGHFLAGSTIGTSNHSTVGGLP